jgi:hypothetical protein
VIQEKVLYVYNMYKIIDIHFSISSAPVRSRSGSLIINYVWCPGQNKRIAPLFLPWMSQKATKGITALTLEIDCDQTTMGLPLVTSAVFLIAK